MIEQVVKKRGWVKNAVIVFLAVMLVLTFFSQTIMNRSLPEVAAMYTSSGTITARIRGSGTVTANDSYEVVLNQTRTVKNVNIRIGTEVYTGDVLFTLSDSGSEELESAVEALNALLLDYERRVISASLDGNYDRENRNIRLAREEINEAKEKRDEMPYSEAGISAAQAEVASAKDEVAAAKAGVASAEAYVENVEMFVASAKAVVDTRQTAVNAARDHLNALGSQIVADTAAIDNQIAAKNTQITANRNEYNISVIIHGTNYELYEEAAEIWASSTSLVPDEQWAAYWRANKATFMAAYARVLEDATGTPTSLLTAYKVLTELDDTHRRLRSERDQLYHERETLLGSDNSAEYNRRRRRLDDAEAALATANTALTTANTNLTGAGTLLTNATKVLTNAEKVVAEAENDLKIQNGYKTDWQAAGESIRSLERGLEDMLFSLSQTQKSDGVTNALSALEMDELRNRIERKRDEISRLENDDTDTVVTSPVNGVVKQINISPGNQTQSGSPLAVIEVADRGYTLRFPVTIEQSRRVSVGDYAEVNRGYWWGGEIRAVLSSIRNDPQNPATSRILEFTVSGDVESGTQLNIVLGERSANYDIIVPNSALRSDTNGDFVLVVLARSSPLGNRYVATRVDVNILASDEVNSAVSGGLSGWGDYVITTSNRPIEPGMQVRLVDNPWG